ncbi:NAD(P)/FAD-dependent oxidoreductase [Halalkalibaculum sp. DA3122]|uniref:NAD(P)/FAD-dependent oxidoreductase n=1 Tax=Halalkalibaculum sp. DA3122 TaxID=3373607 RepID=UPI003753ED30
MNDLSFWEKVAFQTSYDLIVVGAGITGLSSALFYRQSHPGGSVLVLERGAAPRGASTRNAGFACIGSITEHQADLDRIPEEQLKTRIKRRFNGLELLKSTLGADAIGYKPCGGYELFRSQAAFSEAKQQIPKFNRWLLQLAGEEEVYTTGRLNGYPVIFNRLEGALHPGRMMKALIDRAKKAGIEIRWNAEVQQVVPAGFVLLDDGTEFAGDQVLVATNGFVKNLWPGTEVTPARGYILLTAPIDNLEWRGTFHHDRGYLYFRDAGDRLLLGGGRNIAEQEEATDQLGINLKIKEYLVRFAEETLKLPSGWKIEQEWSGIMGFTENKMPVVKHMEGRIFTAAGLSGMGISIGMQVGSEAVELLRSGSKK